MSDIQIVAEIGCNHNGSVELAKKMMKKAKEAGADAVKFQSFVPENLVSRYAPKAEYQKKNDGNGSQLDMLKKLALTETEYLELVQYASTLDIQIFSTPFDFESFSFLQKIGQNIWKVPSGEITNLPYLQRVPHMLTRNSFVYNCPRTSVEQESPHWCHPEGADPRYISKDLSVQVRLP